MKQLSIHDIGPFIAPFPAETMELSLVHHEVAMDLCPLTGRDNVTVQAEVTTVKTCASLHQAEAGKTRCLKDESQTSTEG